MIQEANRGGTDSLSLFIFCRREVNFLLVEQFHPLHTVICILRELYACRVLEPLLDVIFGIYQALVLFQR